jgi:hypothetical protein
LSDELSIEIITSSPSLSPEITSTVEPLSTPILITLFGRNAHFYHLLTIQFLFSDPEFMPEIAIAAAEGMPWTASVRRA